MPIILAKQNKKIDPDLRSQFFTHKNPLFVSHNGWKLGAFKYKEIMEPLLDHRFKYKDLETHPFGVPAKPLRNLIELPSILNVREEVVIEDEGKREELLMGSLIKKRRKKMNKHKYKKRIHRDIAKIRKVRHFRLKKKRGRQAHKKRLLMKKLTNVLEKNPKSDLIRRPYVVYRLKNW